VMVRVSENAPVGVALAPEDMGVPLRAGLLEPEGRPAAATLRPVPQMAVGD
jgi:hypothetical protein